MQTAVVVGSSLFKGRVEQGFRVACHSPAERYSGASEYAACKLGGICGAGKFADVAVGDDRKSPSIPLLSG